jgi:toxin HigB-1
MVDAMQLDDLRQPPGNNLEKLKGDLKTFYTIRINNQFRIIFRLNCNMFVEVSIIDYH